MRHGSLFSGVGGFDLAAEWMGWENIFHCEWNKFGQAVLKHHFPNSISYDDITKTDFTIHRGAIEILTGGFPCQPYSTAGKRKGKDDDRHLWPEMLRAIREIKPTWVVGENVRGLISWNGGMVFDEVQFDLEAEGYEVIPLLLPACAVNAPHRRDRIWFIAHSKCTRLEYRSKGGNIQQTEGKTFREGSSASDVTSPDDFNERLWWYTPHPNNARSDQSLRDNGNGSEEDGGGFTQPEFRKDGNDGATADTSSIRQPRQEHRQERSSESTGYGIPSNWQNFPTQSPIRRGDDGLSDILDSDAVLKATGGRKAESNWVKESIKAYGNAVVPQVVYQIFKAIDELNKTT